MKDAPCCVAAGEGFLSMLCGTGGELGVTNAHSILTASLEMQAVMGCCLGSRYLAFGEKESKC